MENKRLKERLEDLGNALERLKESLELEIASSVILDGTIQRFEFTYELAWKAIKDYMEYQGFSEVRSPREAFKEAFRAGTISDGDAWIDMLQDRNLTAHTYNEKAALEIYNKIKDKHFNNLIILYQVLRKEASL